MILGACPSIVEPGWRALVDVPTWAIALVALLLLTRFRRLPEPV
jgi:hypothetical protein